MFVTLEVSIPKVFISSRDLKVSLLSVGDMKLLFHRLYLRIAFVNLLSCDIICPVLSYIMFNFVLYINIRI